MITVIRHGKRKHMKCTTCDCEFTYEEEDIISTQVGINEWEYWVECPDCDKKILVPYWRNND